jgi:uncharacterized protein YktB (UPF0637 family)
MSNIDQVAEQAVGFAQKVKEFNKLMAHLTALSLSISEQREVDSSKAKALNAGKTVTQHLTDSDSEVLDHASAQFEQASELIDEGIQALRRLIERRRDQRSSD